MDPEVNNAPAPASTPAAPATPPAPAAPAPAPTDAPAPAPAAAAPAAPAEPPVEYKVEVPEGFTANPELLTEFTALAKDAKLAPDVAQKFVGLATKMQEQQIALHKQTVEGWKAQVQTGKDSEGKPLPEHLAFPTGEKFAPALATAKKALDASPPELKALLESSGMGNHPAVLRAFLNFGKMMEQDGFVPSTPGAAGSGSGDSFEARAARMYANSTPSK